MSGALFAVRPQRVDVPFSDDDALAVYAARTGFPVLRDRFGFLNAFSRWRLHEDALPFPSSGSTANFADLMDQRAADIVARIRKEEKDLYILLSGGVDSTAMTLAVLRAAEGDFRHLHVVFNESTEDEYPAFVTYLCGTGIDMVRCLPHEIEDVQERLLETGYTLAGWGADQLFGSAVSQRWPEWYHLDWKKWVAETPGIRTDAAVEQWEAAFSHYSLPVKTFGELAWFMNFATKYDIVVNSDALYSGRVTHRMINFYDTQDFNDWSVSNFDVLHRYEQQDTQHYKIPLKDYIFAFNHDAAYRSNKGKIRSWVRAGYHEEEKYCPRAALLETPERIVFRRESVRRPLFDALSLSGVMTRNLLRFYRKRA